MSQTRTRDWDESPVLPQDAMQLRAMCIKLAIGTATPDDSMDPEDAVKRAQYFYDWCWSGKVEPWDGDDD